MFPIKSVNILDTIVGQKKLEVAKLPARVLAAGDLRDAMLERGEQRDFLAALKSRSSRGNEAQKNRKPVRASSRRLLRFRRAHRRGQKSFAVGGCNLQGLRSGPHHQGIRGGGRKLPFGFDGRKSAVHWQNGTA